MWEGGGARIKVQVEGLGARGCPHDDAMILPAFVGGMFWQEIPEKCDGPAIRPQSRSLSRVHLHIVSGLTGEDEVRQARDRGQRGEARRRVDLVVGQVEASEGLDGGRGTY